MPAAATPFDFNDFDAPVAAPAPIKMRTKPAVTYTQAELDDAIAEARKDAVKAIAAAEAIKQTALMDEIAARLNRSLDAENARIAQHVETLTAIAENIVTTFCADAGLARQGDIALGMVDRFLQASETRAEATLVIPAKTSKRCRARIEKALADREADHVAIVADKAMAQGDARLEWRGGAMAQSGDDIQEQIKALFSATRTKAPAKLARKDDEP